MGLLRRIVPLVASRKMREYEYILDHPWEVTQEKLMEILRRNRDTIYGRRFGFDSITGPEDYSQKVPLTDAVRLKPYLEMVYQQPRGRVLTADPVIYYLQTAGSTGRPKRMPVTKRGLKDVSTGSAMVWMSYIAEDPEHAKILDGSLITFGASSKLDEINGVSVGYATGVYAKTANVIFRRLIKPGEDIFNIQDMEAKVRAYAEYLVRENVTGFQGITSLSMMLIRRVRNDLGPWLLKRFSGTKYEDRLRSVMDSEGRIDVGRLWPNVRFFLASGINTEPYRPWIKAMFPQVDIREVYGASEGIFAGQLYGDIQGMQLYPHLNYLEFIPVESVDEVEPETVPITDLKPGKRYEMVITNAEGYYRYRIGDLVTVARTDPLTIRSVDRRGHVLNLSGEKVSKAHIESALTAALAKTDTSLVGYVVSTVVEDGIGHYVIYACFYDSSNLDREEFISTFEEAMKSINEEFRVVRETGAIGPTELREMDWDTYESIIRERGQQGKPPAMCKTGELEEILNA